jgi:uncharacterized protein YdaU (DUF1376 family)
MPYIQLYPADYLADTAHLNTEEHGAYLLLIMNYWQRGKALPADPARLACIVHLAVDRWRAMESTLREFFEVVGDCWVHRRIERDLARIAQRSDQASRAGKSSAAQRLGNGRSTDVERALNERSTDVERPRERALIYTDKNRQDKNRSDRARALGSMARRLRDAGVRVTPAHPELARWIDLLAPDQIMEAVARARIHKPAPESIPARYLTPIIEEIHEQLMHPTKEGSHAKFPKSATRIFAEGLAAAAPG